MDWAELVVGALRRFRTPFYLLAWSPIARSLRMLGDQVAGLPLRHWLSFKTQPVRPVVQRWRAQGLGVEVVSEFELHAALAEGFDGSHIIANGTAKHRWLTRFQVPALTVHFDSVHEVRSLAAQARELGWRTGLRLHLAEEFDPDDPSYGAQFGLTCEEAGRAIELLDSHGLVPESMHFHLRSNVQPISYEKALIGAAELCRKLQFDPLFVDCGGGLPIQYGLVDGEARDEELARSYRHVLEEASHSYSKLKEMWLENGTFLTGRGAVLVVTVCDVKERPEGRYLVCDGGRTNHAFVSDWESHRLLVLPERCGRLQLTTVCGPNCMAYDRLIRTHLPADIGIGDHIVWLDAGAYHIPWETRFSRGLATVVWYDEQEGLQLARDAETPDAWWGVWR